MKQKALSRWLKWILLGVGLCGLIVYFLLIPDLGRRLQVRYPEFAGRFWPWLLFVWGSGIPCYGVLFLAWKIVRNIGLDRSFTEENAAMLTWISGLSAGAAAYFFAGNLLLFLLDMSHPSVVLGSMLVVFVGVAVAVAAAALSHLVQKAAALQDQSDWTI